MEDSAYHSGDRVWRMPLWKYYSDQIQSKKELNLLIDRKDSIKKFTCKLIVKRVAVAECLRSF